MSSLFQAFRRCRVRGESREKIAIKRNRKKNHFMNCTMRGRGGGGVGVREGWEEKVNYNMDPSRFPLHTAQVTLAMCITLPSFGAVNAQRRLACVAGAIGTVYILRRSVSLGQKLRGICCE